MTWRILSPHSIVLEEDCPPYYRTNQFKVGPENNARQAPRRSGFNCPRTIVVFRRLVVHFPVRLVGVGPRQCAGGHGAKQAWPSEISIKSRVTWFIYCEFCLTRGPRGAVYSEDNLNFRLFRWAVVLAEILKGSTLGISQFNIARNSLDFSFHFIFNTFVTIILPLLNFQINSTTLWFILSKNQSAKKTLKHSSPS